jgi:hypothetical protein
MEASSYKDSFGDVVPGFLLLRDTGIVDSVPSHSDARYALSDGMPLLLFL